MMAQMQECDEELRNVLRELKDTVTTKLLGSRDDIKVRYVFCTCFVALSVCEGHGRWQLPDIGRGYSSWCCVDPVQTAVAGIAVWIPVVQPLKTLSYRFSPLSNDTFLQKRLQNKFRSSVRIWPSPVMPWRRSSSSFQ